MTYDDHAKLLAVKVIGTVESGLNYTAVNYGDPITVGIMQWYGTRAAGILTRIANEESSSWSGAAQSIKDSLSAHPATDGYWNSRWLTREEGESLKPILKTAAHIQTNQAQIDFEAYKQVAINIGMDIDGNTNAVIFFFCMYHQGPKYAMQVMATAGSSANIDRLRAVCLNNAVLGQYKTRYNTAYDLIIAGDTSGVDEPDDPTPAEPGGDSGDGEVRATGNISYIEQVGTHLVIHQKDKSKLFAYFDGRQRWVVTQDKNTGADVPDPAPDDPDPNPGPPNEIITNIVNWLKSKIGAYSYSQGPGRLEPDKNGYTDCSALMYYAFMKFANIQIGTWTGGQQDTGTEVSISSAGAFAESKLKIGDLVFFNWTYYKPSYDHVDMYIGNNQVIGHGGPGSGPTIKELSGRIANCNSWRVRRYV